MSFYERPATSILHPTDFSPASEHAFAHALAIAVANKASLTILHVQQHADEDLPWHEYPSVRTTLERWGMIEPGTSHEDVGRLLGIVVEKEVVVDKHIVKSIVDFCENRFFDLIVMATDENREPFGMRAHVAVPVSQKTHLPTLYVPQDVRGCFLAADGSSLLKEILLPVNYQPDSQPALERIAWIMDKIGNSKLHVTLLHVVNKEGFPPVVPVDDEHIAWSFLTRRGDVAAEIVSAAREMNADVIAMVTEGRKGFWDAIRGSTAQQVLRKAPCPVFTLPAGI